MSHVINGVIELSFFFEVKNLNPVDVAELREMLEKVLSDKIGSESFSTFVPRSVFDNSGSSASRAGTLPKVRVRLRVTRGVF